MVSAEGNQQTWWFWLSSSLGICLAEASVVRLVLFVVYEARPPITTSLGIPFIPQLDLTYLSAYTWHQPLKGRMEGL